MLAVFGVSVLVSVATAAQQAYVAEAQSRRKAPPVAAPAEARPQPPPPRAELTAPPSPEPEGRSASPGGRDTGAPSVAPVAASAPASPEDDKLHLDKETQAQGAELPGWGLAVGTGLGLSKDEAVVSVARRLTRSLWLDLDLSLAATVRDGFWDKLETNFAVLLKQYLGTTPARGFWKAGGGISEFDPTQGAASWAPFVDLTIGGEYQFNPQVALSIAKGLRVTAKRELSHWSVAMSPTTLRLQLFF
jgi:hypothetical protein